MNRVFPMALLVLAAAGPLCGRAVAAESAPLTLLNSGQGVHVQTEITPAWAGNDHRTHVIWSLPFAQGRIQLLKHESYDNVILEVIPADQTWQGIGKVVAAWKPNQPHLLDVAWIADGLGKGHFVLGIDGRRVAEQTLVLPRGQARELVLPATAAADRIKVTVAAAIPDYLRPINPRRAPPGWDIPATYEPSALSPAPKKIRRGTASVSYKTGIDLMCVPELVATAEPFCQAVHRRYGLAVTPAPADALPAPGRLRLELRLNPACANAARAEAYKLTAAPGMVRIVAAQPAGIFRGLQTLRKIMADGDEAAGSFSALEIEDYPELSVRGHYVEAMWSGVDVEKFKEVIDAASLAGLNLIFIDHGSTFHYPSVPELKCLMKGVAQNTPAEIRGLAKYARQRGVLLAPAMRCFSHAEWFTANFPELAEPGPRQAGGVQNYCPSNPATHRLIFKLMDDLLEAYQDPRIMHIGEDEHFHGNIGVCPGCRTRSPGELVGRDVAALAAHLRSKKTRTYLFNDALTPPALWHPEEGDSAAVAPAGGPARPGDEAGRAADLVPKDVTVTYWYYGDRANGFAGAGYLAKLGFAVLPMPWKDPDNVRLAVATAQTIGAPGVVGSSWTADWRQLPDTATWGALLQGADAAWTVARPGGTAGPAGSAAELGNRFMALSKPVDRIDFARIIPLGLPAENAGTPFRGWLGLAETFDPATVLPHGTTATYRQIPFRLPRAGSHGLLLRGPDAADRLPERAAIPVARTVSHLFFLQGCGLVFEPKPTGKVLFHYTVNYADGTKVRLPQRFGYEVETCHSGAAPANARVAFGKQLPGDIPLQMYIFSWTNPRPAVRVTSVDVVSEKQVATPLVLAVSGLPCE